MTRTPQLSGVEQTGVDSAANESPKKSDEEPKDDHPLVDDLAALFGYDEERRDPAAPPKAESSVEEPESPPPTVQPAGSASPTTATPELPGAKTPAEWQAERQELRALARQAGPEKLSAMFRLDAHDAETMSGVITQYGMEALVAVPSQGVFFTVPYRQSLGRERPIETAPELSRRFGLSVNHLSLPWLENLRQEYVANRLVPLALVEASLLVPKAEAEVILGRIVDGCHRMGFELEEVQACYGTFARLELGNSSLFRYEMTRLVLRDGREVCSTEHHASDNTTPDPSTL